MNKYKKAFEILNKKILDIYPFNEIELKRFENKQSLFLKKIINFKTDKSFFEVINKYILTLENSHTRLSSYPGKKFYKPRNYTVNFCNNNFFLFNDDKNLGKIIKIDNKNPHSLFKEIKKTIPGTTNQFLEKTALLWMLTSTEKNDVSIVLDSGNELKARREATSKKRKKPCSYELLNELLIFKINSFTYEEADAGKIDGIITKNYNPNKGMIIDLRGNMGGDSGNAEKITSRFINKKIKAGSVILRKDKDNPTKTFKKARYIEPLGKYLKPNIILLIDSFCFSSCEIFISGMIDNKLAKTVGVKTGGGSGNPKKINIPFGNDFFEVQISSWKFFNNNGQPLEGNGIGPDYEIINDLNEKCDKQLKKAIELLL